MIALLSDNYRPKIDGISISLEALIREFDRRNIGYDLFVPMTPGRYEDAEHIYRFHSVPLIFQPEVRFSLPVDPHNLNRAFTNEYDLVHSHTPGPLGIVAMQMALLNRIPHVHTFHTYLPDYGHYVFNGAILSQSRLNKISAWWAGRMDYIIAPSGKIKEWLVRMGVTAPIEVIPSGISLQTFTDASDDFFVREGYTQAGDQVALFVGRLGEEKSVGQLIDYFYHAVSQLPVQVKLGIVGDGPQRAELQRKVNEFSLSGRVFFTGYVDPLEISSVYRSADVFVFLSSTETQGLVVLEAMAAGLPLILKDDLAYQGMLEPGKNGFAVNSSDDFAKHLKELIDDGELRKKFAGASREIVRRFDIKTTTSRVESYYQRAIYEYRRKNGRSPSKNIIKSATSLRRRLQSSLREFQDRIKENV